MNHMVRIAFNPYLCLPSDVVNVPLELPEVREGADINPPGLAFFQGLSQLYLPFWGERAMGSDRLYKEKHFLLFIIKNNIGQLVMLGNRDVKLLQQGIILVQQLSRCVSHIQDFAFRAEPFPELFYPN